MLLERARSIFKNFGWENLLTESIWLWDQNSFLTIKDHHITKHNRLEIVLIGVQEDKRREGLGTKIFLAFRNSLTQILNQTSDSPAKIEILVKSCPEGEDFFSDIGFKELSKKDLIAKMSPFEGKPFTYLILTATLMSKIRCPVEGCHFTCKFKGLSSHIRHKHPEFVQE